MIRRRNRPNSFSPIRRNPQLSVSASVSGSVAVVVALVTLSACGGSERTGSSFCRQVAEELPEIGQRMVTSDDVRAMVSRYQRLLERAPLEIESDIQSVVDLLQLAAKVNASDPQDVQELADKTYATNQAANAVRAWVQDTCAVDIATGALVEPARTVPPTTIANSVVPDSAVPSTVPPTSAP